MKYVLDTSIAAKWVLSEPDSAKALALLDDFENNLTDLVSPDIILGEVAHALTRAERRGLIRRGEAMLKLADLLSNTPRLLPFIQFLPRAVELSSQERIGVYDCLYVALAEHEQCELATADVRLFNIFQGKIPVVLLSSL